MTIETARPLTRRSLLSHASIIGVSALAAGSVAVATAQVAAGEDPTFGLIEAHKKACTELNDALGWLPDDDPREEPFWDALHETEEALATTEPPTMAGVIAILRYAREYESSPRGSQWPDGSDGRDPWVWRFTEMLEGALAKIGGAA